MRDSIIEKVMKEICRGETVSPYMLSEKLGIPVERINMILTLLVSNGLLKTIRFSSCTQCPLAKICPYAGRKSGANLKIYVLTERGKTRCKSTKH